MMRLSTMWNVDCTVDDDGRGSVADQIIEPWDHDRDSVRFFRSSANFVYVFRNRGKRCFLRFADASERSRAAIEAEADIHAWLAAAGIDVARPLPSRPGNVVETSLTDRGTFHAVVFAALEGTQLAIDALDESRFRAWGAALGKLHAAMSGYAGPGLAARGTWRDHLESAREAIPADQTAIRQERDRIASILGTLPVNHDTYGPIHFDFELDNLCWHDHAIGILDFDDCAHHWYVADIAFALRDLFDAGADLADPRARAFTHGYAAHHPLDDDLLSHLPIFSRLARLLNYARIARALDLSDDRTPPDWLTALSGRLRNRMDAYETSLEDRSL